MWSGLQWWLVRSLGICLALALSACVHPLPSDVSLPEQVLADKTLRASLVQRGAADSEFVHEILHELGEAPRGEPQRLARLVAEHLHHHPDTARAVFQELARGRDFQEWLTERLQARQE